MRDFSPITKIYIFSTMFLGILLLGWNLQYLQNIDWPMLLGLILLASLTMVLKVEGATNRSHYAISYVIYGFSLVRMGAAETMLVILASYFIEWIWYRPSWFISAFNSACFIIVAQVAYLVYFWINPNNDLQSVQSVVAIIISVTVFTLLNHLMVGIIIWLARGENFSQSGMFDLIPLLIDLTLFTIGASLNLVWNFNPFAILLFLLPLYLLYSTLRVPFLERQTEIDQKTGLYNHGHFMGQLDHELARANRFNRPFSVIMGDLDLLRNINNTYGHLAGDEVLIGIARILKESVREYDIVARFGGEEFAILMPETDSQTAFRRAESIRKTIALAEFTVPTSVEPIQITMSFGVASRTEADQTKEELIHHADVMLYRAKLAGRNRTQIFQSDENGPSDEEFERDTLQPLDGHFADRGYAHSYSAAYTHYQPSGARPEQDSLSAETQSGQSEETKKHKPKIADRRENEFKDIRVNIFIVSVTLISTLLFSFFYQPFQLDQIWALLIFATFVALTEWFSIDIYVRDTAVSTSAAPMLAGALLFGPVGSLVLCLVFAFTAYIKFRGPLNRIIFNAANQLFPAMIYLGIIQAYAKPYLTWTLEFQLLFCILAAMITFFTSTVFVSAGMHIRSREGLIAIWKNQFSWLFSFYIVMGLMGYALIFGYINAGYIGLILITTPLMILRFGQEQFIGRTKKVVLELRDKNVRLQKKSQEISEINNGLLETLAEVIDLRDENVLNHSRSVTYLATQIAKEVKLPSRQIETIRQASLLHDIGKLGIPDNILGKPASLTVEEFSIIKRHPEIGALLLEKSISLKGLVPIVRYHHEHFDGSGYPEGLKGNQIPLEARIVAIADAIEAMASNRPYHKQRNWDEIVCELENGAGSQFDPEIVAVAIKIIRSQQKLRNQIEK